MAFTLQGTGSGTTDKTAGTTWVFNSGTSYTTGTWVIMTFAFDNVSTTDTQTDLVSISDAENNTYTIALQFTNGQGSALAGASVAIVLVHLTGGTFAGNITATFNGSVTAKAVLFRNFTVTSGNSVAVETNGTGTLANDNADAGIITLSSMTSREHLVIRACAVENNTATGTTSTNYTALTTSGTGGTTGGNAATNQWIQSEYRIVTSTSETTDPTTGSADIASAMVAFYEFTPVAPTTDGLLGLLGCGS